ncbi:ATP-binding cassette domain-containing protein, partial [Chloroflexota bacterium]
MRQAISHSLDELKIIGRINDMISGSSVIRVCNSSPWYGNFAVKNISFKVSKGETFGFLGPSGAGKSTTQGILTGLLKLQDGEVLVAG